MPNPARPPKKLRPKKRRAPKLRRKKRLAKRTSKPNLFQTVAWKEAVASRGERRPFSCAGRFVAKLVGRAER
jgi:hypothetical protein